MDRMYNEHVVIQMNPKSSSSSTSSTTSYGLPLVPPLPPSMIVPITSRKVMHTIGSTSCSTNGSTGTSFRISNHLPSRFKPLPDETYFDIEEFNLQWPGWVPGVYLTFNANNNNNNNNNSDYDESESEHNSNPDLMTQRHFETPLSGTFLYGILHGYEGTWKYANNQLVWKIRVEFHFEHKVYPPTLQEAHKFRLIGQPFPNRPNHEQINDYKRVNDHEEVVDESKPTIHNHAIKNTDSINHSVSMLTVPMSLLSSTSNVSTSSSSLMYSSPSTASHVQLQQQQQHQQRYLQPHPLDASQGPCRCTTPGVDKIPYFLHYYYYCCYHYWYGHYIQYYSSFRYQTEQLPLDPESRRS